MLFELLKPIPESSWSFVYRFERFCNDNSIVGREISQKRYEGEVAIVRGKRFQDSPASALR